MLPLLSQLAAHVKSLLNRFPPEKRAQAVISFLLLGAAGAALIVWALRPQYKALYGDLSLEDSGEIVQVLQKEHVPYKLDQEGRRILVPSEKLYETRMKLAAAQLPKERSAGWELFDQNSLGVTDFVQKLNYKRALEGELSRTILQMDPIEAVRVHLVIPDESLFKENQRQTAASVTLRMKRGQKLSPPQVEGIGFLISSAVEGLQPENVTVIDSRGFILSEKVDTNPAVRLTASQLELQTKVEATLVQKGQSLLDKRFGYGRSALQVTALLDFEQREKTSEVWDADNPAVRSEEITSSSSTGADTSSSSTENNVTNYEIGSTREHITSSLGDIKRLSVAVMVDGKYTTVEGADGKKTHDFSSLPQQEIDEISKTIQAALGYNSFRGDEISVVCVPFLDGALVDDSDMVGLNKWDMLFQHSQKILILAAVITLLLMVRGFLKKAQSSALALDPALALQLPAGSAPGGVPQLEAREAPPPQDFAMQNKTQEIKERQAQLSGFVVEQPEVAARLVRSWLVEE